jgi:hypothetical protein
MRPLTLFLFLIFSLASFASVGPVPVTHPKFDLRKIKLKELEKLSGEKLTLFQKIKLKIALKAFGRLEDGTVTERQLKQANTAMILGIGSLVLLPLAFTSIGIIALLSVPSAIAAIILGRKSLKGNSNKKGKIGVITGVITLSAIVLYTLLVIIFFSGFTFE